MEHFAQIILLLSVAVVVVAAFQRLHIPTSLGYLLVGVILGPHTSGPTVYVPEFEALAEFGVVFLLFTIGLNFSLPQLYLLRHQVLGLGTGQILLTIAIVGAMAWLAGIPAAAAFVVGAVFAQSSSTIIGSLLGEQGEENHPPCRLGLALSVFQDVTAAPLLVIIPVLGGVSGADGVTSALGWAVGKAVAVLVLVYFSGRWVFRPLFHLVAERRSAELFTLAVLLIALLAAWATHGFGLSLAFGGFLAGMILGETEFRHQVEASIRPFRDVLLGLFFIGIGMRFDPLAIPPIWHWTLAGAGLMVVVKTLVVTAMLWMTGADGVAAWRTGLLLAVGGEFGFALIVVALDFNVIDGRLGQIAISSVLLSMIVGALLIRFNHAIATGLAGGKRRGKGRKRVGELPDLPEPQVVIGGYGRVGHTIAALFKANGVPFTAFDVDPKRVALGRAEGHPVLYGDISDPELLATLRLERASLVLITLDHSAAALRTAALLSQTHPQVPIIARARDLEASSRLREAGATHAYPEMIEAGLWLGATALRMLRVPDDDIDLMLQEVRDWNYQPVLEERDKP